MTFEQIDRKQCKWEAAELLRDAQVSPKAMTALYMGLIIVLELFSSLVDTGFFGIFLSILVSLISTVLASGFALYCMAVRRGERAEFLTLFDGFSFVGKLILLDILFSLFVFLWSLLFIIPGVIAAYRYGFAFYNLYEDPSLGVMEALDMSKRQTLGYKSQLFVLDLSYIGWVLLASLPTLLLIFQINRDLTMSVLYGIPVPSTYFGLPIFILNAVFGLWQLLVALFYVPNCICVKLSYFDVAKRTSGVGLGTEEPSAPWDGWNAPDGLG
ncbi:DUF975 family protein [Oscillibacter sp.]|uniref:DUF975 family protein n=1 Tax=Oscillibacter sp. TaxID=1945593 RepID=UPI002D7F5EEC|nr:DUF975 family protein [Oscillibacter sp.]